jgi:peroxiredoxin
MRIVLLALVILLGSAVSSGAAVRDLVLPALKPDGKGAYQESTYKLVDIAGRKPVVILYWVPSVASSVDELKRFNEFAKGAAKSPVVFLSAARAVDAQERNDVERVAATLKLSVPVLLDGNLTLAQEMKAQFLPNYFGLNAKGVVAFENLSSLVESTAQGKTLAAALTGAKDIPTLSAVPPRELRAGDMAPDFALPDMNGKPYRLADALKSGKRALLIFWSAYCPHCQRELPRIQKFLDARKQPYEVLSVTRLTSEQDRTVTGAYLINNGITFPVLVDGGSVISRYHVQGIPMWMVVDSNGRIVTVQTGEQKGLEALLLRYVK